jgi:hypothetical protein
MLYEILVVDYVADYKSLTNDDIIKLNSNLINSQFLQNCPNGTIIGIPIDGERNNQKKVYYPALSHISMPIKSGERAWAFEQKSHLVPYWLSRKVQNTSAEDLNFTHDDRARLFPLLEKDTGGKQKVSSTFYDARMSVVSLEDVRKNAISRKEFIGEPTLPVKCKSTDLSLQGSNGTLINLSNESEGGSATINIVAGISGTSQAENIKNSEKYYEVVKPAKSAQLSVDDSSRLTVSQKFNADEYYNLPGESSDAIPTISLKTGAVRIFAQNDLKIIAGPEDNRSTIIIKNDGNIVITPAKQIKLSGDSDDQPYLRYDEFRKVISGIEDIAGGLQAGLTAIAGIVDGLASGAATVAITPSNTSIGQAVGNVEAAMSSIRSTKILGS